MNEIIDLKPRERSMLETMAGTVLADPFLVLPALALTSWLLPVPTLVCASVLAAMLAYDGRRRRQELRFDDIGARPHSL